ncbi:hypothetical protein BT93_F2938 [Corymbia citriodora subsp. variegata]|nr:hypothetical protein BT93_F2938 [Corymbia citriodora subsp. variegata]KAF8026288.1 hypothetical protein BT93_F2938 [Corymbia citriodora subsp. variegata]KAF8026289.1 hypothetical protein BT93_F2938 [Corymbia citriodora subsp. variegata]
MEASSISSSPVISSTIRQPFGGTRVADRSRPFANRICWRRSGPLNERTTSRRIIAAIDGVSAAVADPGQAEVTWQIVAGAIAGVTPFVVAGIEFSKRIVRLYFLDSPEKMRSLWWLRACPQGEVLFPLSRMWWVSPMAVVEKILLRLGCIYRFFTRCS